MSAKRKGAGYGILFLLGSLFGAIAALFMSTDEEGSMKTPVKKKVRQLKAFSKDMKEKERLSAVFGSVTKEGKRIYGEARAQLVEELTNLKEALDEVDKTKYTELVGAVMERMKGEGRATAKQMAKIKKYLLEDYKTLKKSANKDA